MDGGRDKCLKVSELNKRVKERAYQECLCGKYKVLRIWDVESVNKDLKKFRDTMKESYTNCVCGEKCRRG